VGAITPLRAKPDWKPGVSTRTSLVLWYEDTGGLISIASPTLGLGVEARSLPGLEGDRPIREVVFQLAVDPFAALLYTGLFSYAAVAGMPH
jgi:hypothetical protein